MNYIHKVQIHTYVHHYTGTDAPTLRYLNAHVKPLVTNVWYDLGLQLLDSTDVDIIKLNYRNDASGACTEMFSQWLQKNPSASWNLLISVIKGAGVKKCDVAYKIEQMLQPGNEQIEMNTMYTI